jgi:hypothetical protein
MTTTTEEAPTFKGKLQLMEKVGMRRAALNLLEREEMKKEAANLTAMKFILTTERKVRAKLEKLYFHGPSEATAPLVGFGFICLTASISTAICDAGWPFWAALGTVALMATGGAVASLMRMCEVKVMDLENWRDNVPYGGLLAVQEARERGLQNFRILYPTRREDVVEPVRLETDPVIIGYTNHGQMVEVFAWDDGKIYDADLK